MRRIDKYVRRAALGLLPVLVAVGCGEPARTYPDPPAGSYMTGTFQVKVGDAATSEPGATVSAEFFGAAKALPLIGRAFIEADSAVGASPVVILSRALWQRRFGAAPDIIGRPIDIDGRQTIIVGIMPQGFDRPSGAQLWVVKKPLTAPDA